MRDVLTEAAHAATYEEAARIMRTALRLEIPPLVSEKVRDDEYLNETRADPKSWVDCDPEMRLCRIALWLNHQCAMIAFATEEV